MALNNLMCVCVSYPDRETEQLEEAKVVSGGEQRSVSGERRGVDVGDVAVRRPDSLTARTQNTRPAGPLNPLQLHTHIRTHTTKHTITQQEELVYFPPITLVFKMMETKFSDCVEQNYIQNIQQPELN